MAFVQDKAVGFTMKGARASALPARVAAGPFDVAPPRDGQRMTMADTLLTGLLVIYPVLAIVAAVIVGLTLSGSVV